MKKAENETFIAHLCQATRSKGKTAVKDIPASETKRVAAYYDMNGRRIGIPQRGINIVRYEDGTVKKMLVK